MPENMEITVFEQRVEAGQTWRHLTEIDCLPKWISRNMDVKGDIDKSSFIVGNVIENASISLENTHIYMYISHPMNRKQNAHGK